MEEEVVDYLYKWALSDGFKKSKEDFVKLLQTNDEVLSYAFEFAQKDGFKKDKNALGALVGRTTTAAPVATTEPTITEPTTAAPATTAPAKTEPTVTEPVKTEPTATIATETAPAKTEPAKELGTKPLESVKDQGIPQREAEMPTADTTKMPPMVVREAEPEVKEEPKKEMPIGENLMPITEKTEVKAVETPSDKMVIKSEKKEEVIPSYKNIDKNIDIAGGVFIDKSNVSDKLDAKELSPKEILEKDLLGKNWHEIELNRNVSSRYPDPPNVNTKKLKSYNQDEDFNVFKPIDIEGKKFYSNYDKKNNKWYIYEEGSNKDNWTEVKAGPIKSMLSSKYLKDGQPIKESRDYSESDYNEIESAKKKLSYSKYLQYLVSNLDNLSVEDKSKVKDILGSKDSDKYYRWISSNVEDPKIVDFWVNALEKFDIKSSYLDDIKKRRDELTQQPQGNIQVKEVTEQPKMEVKEVTKEEPKMVIKSEKKGKGKVAPEPIKIEPIKFETKEGQIQVEVPTFAIDEPRKKYKPYGEKGPDVYYSEDFDQFIIKEGNERTVASKGSPKYTEIETKLAQAAGATKEGKGKCDTPPFIGCSPNKTALNEFLYYGLDDEGRGLRSTDEGGLIEKLDNRKQIMEERGESLWSLYDREESTKGEGDFYYANEAPPKSDRFIVYKPYGDDKTLIYDKESNIILKQLDGKAPFVDAQSKTRTVYNTNGDVFRKGSDPKEFWRNYAKENPNEGLTVWKAYEVDQPEYKELKSIIEGIDYKKAKGSKNTFIPTFNPVPETPEWQKQ